MGIQSKASKKVSSLTKTVKASDTITVQLTEASFQILNDAIAKNNHFQAEAQKTAKDLSNNLVVAIEGAGFKAEDFVNANLNPESKSLILTRK